MDFLDIFLVGEEGYVLKKATERPLMPVGLEPTVLRQILQEFGPAEGVMVALDSNPTRKEVVGVIETNSKKLKQKADEYGIRSLIYYNEQEIGGAFRNDTLVKSLANSVRVPSASYRILAHRETEQTVYNIAGLDVVGNAKNAIRELMDWLENPVAATIYRSDDLVGRVWESGSIEAEDRLRLVEEIATINANFELASKGYDIPLVAYRE